MLSTQAFNALLKTLEGRRRTPSSSSPPPRSQGSHHHPVAVLRFDLRRVDAGLLVAHLERIAAAETIEVEPAALALIARAAEGSVRDALSLLDRRSRMPRDLYAPSMCRCWGSPTARG